MRQRIVIAIALAANPDILICDEPTTALDVTIQSQILELINRLKKERQLSVIFITHESWRCRQHGGSCRRHVCGKDCGIWDRRGCVLSCGASVHVGAFVVYARSGYQ